MLLISVRGKERGGQGYADEQADIEDDVQQSVPEHQQQYPCMWRDATFRRNSSAK